MARNETMTTFKMLLTACLVLAPIANASAQDAAAGHHMAAMGTPDGGVPTVTLGALTISGGAVKAMLPGAKVGGGGLTIANAGPADDRLLSVESSVAGRVELHEMVMQGDVMKMRRLDGGIPVPAGQAVALKGGGLHLMFMDVKTPFTPGHTVPISLVFEKAGRVDYTLPVGTASGQ